MKLLAGEYKKQLVHNWYKVSYYTFPPRILIDDKTQKFFVDFYHLLHNDKDENLKRFYNAYGYSSRF